MPGASFPSRVNYVRKAAIVTVLLFGVSGLATNYFTPEIYDPIGFRLIPMGAFLINYLISFRKKLTARRLERMIMMSYILSVVWLSWVLYKNHLLQDYTMAVYIITLALPPSLVSIRDLWVFMISSVVIISTATFWVEDPVSNRMAFIILFYAASISIFQLQYHILKNRSKVYMTEKRLLDVINASRECIWEFGRDHKFVFISDRATEILGYSPEEMLQMTPFDFVAESERPVIRNWFEYLSSKRKEIHNVEYRAVRKDGKKIWLEITGVPFFSEEGEYMGYRGVLLDISGRKQQQKTLIEAKERAEEAAKARSQFLSVMSHEIRTPMNAVIGTTHLLMQEEPREDQLDNLQTLQFSAENLLVIINDILDYSKIEAGKIEFESTDFSLNTLMERIFKSLQQKASEKNLQFVLRPAPDLPAMIQGDPTRLSQILTNLLNNAIKFTEKGQVSLTTEVRQIDSGVVEIRFSVSDTGIGIPPEKIDTIFDSFTQASSDTTRKYGGTGLGLAICKKLVELQGGKLEVKSIVGEGSVFSFSLKIKVAEKPLTPGEYDSPKEDFQDLGGVRILLVEDNVVNQKIATKFLSKWGVMVEIAGNGKIALDMVEKNTYDLLLMDLQMPEMDGYEATRQIRSLSEPLCRIPIIALTASAMNEVRGSVEEAGMDAYASKPFNPRELYRKIAALLPVSDLPAAG
ncbi:MAG: ATP-binding protein [Bacteroidia bacterium]